MANEVYTIDARRADPASVFGGYRPNTSGPVERRTLVDPATGQVYFPVANDRPGVPFAVNVEFRVMSYLLEDEWKAVDTEVVAASEYPLRTLNDLRAAGLVNQTSPDVLLAQWYTQGNMTAATTNMLGRSMADRDLPEVSPVTAPIPMIYKDLSFSTRGIGASRRIGQGIDLTMVSLGTRVVAEQIENLIVNGDTSLTFSGATLYGLLTHPDVTTDTAANFGGGDFGTAGNAEKTFAGMVNSLNGENFRGPFTAYVSETQYNQMAHVYNDTAGADVTSLRRVLDWPSIRSIFPLPSSVLADGKVILAQMTRDVVEYNEGAAIQVREWQSGNGMEVFFRIMAIGGPAVKSRQDGTSGIRVATAA